MSRNVRPRQEGERKTGLQAGAVPLLHRRVGPVHREARRDEDQRVDPRDEGGPVEPGRRPVPVDAVVHDAVEEVNGEERAEEHDLRRDEQEHPEQRRRHPRAVVDRRRAVVVLEPAVLFGVRGHRTPTGCAEMTCSTGRPRVLSQPLHEIAAQPAAPLTRERRDDDLVDALVVHDVTRSGVGIRMDDLAVRIDSLPAQLRQARAAGGGRRPRAPPRRPGARRSGSSPAPPDARLRIRSSSSSESTVWFAITRTFVSSSERSPSTTTCCTGTGAATRSMSCTTSRRSQPERSAPCVETTISSIAGSIWASASLTACTGPVSTTKPCVATPSSRSAFRTLSSRRPAAARRVSSYTT